MTSSSATADCSMVTVASWPGCSNHWVGAMDGCCVGVEVMGFEVGTGVPQTYLHTGVLLHEQQNNIQ